MAREMQSSRVSPVPAFGGTSSTHARRSGLIKENGMNINYEIDTLEETVEPATSGDQPIIGTIFAIIVVS